MLLARDIGATFWPCTGCFKKVAPLKLWWNLNIKINLQKLVDICGYELPTNLQNFMQKDLTKVKIFWKVLGGGLLFLKHLVLVWLWITVAGKWFPLKKLVLMVLLGMRKRQQKAAASKSGGSGYGIKSRSSIDQMDCVQPLCDDEMVWFGICT